MDEQQWLPRDMHASWQNFLDTGRIKQLHQIAEQVGEQYDPAPELVLRFLTTDLSQMQVVILGQDPYPQPGVATGRAFEVGGLTTWTTPFAQASLRNILRLLYKTDHGITDYGAIPAFKQIRQEIQQDSWRILPPHRLFAAWERQGVLLLNTSFTVGDRPGSHRTLWLEFTQGLVQFISSNEPQICWFLWGQHAQSFIPQISQGVTFARATHALQSQI